MSAPPRRVLVTGATGFIGRHVVAMLLAEGSIVKAVSRSGASLGDASGDVVDVTNVSELAGAVEKFRPDAVVHLAAAIPDGAAGADDRGVFEACVAGSLSVVECCRASGIQLIHASSSAVYGSFPGSVPAREDMLPVPDSLYGVAKLAGDFLVLQLDPVAGVPAAALRISAPFGPGNRRPSVVSRMIAAALRSEDLQLYGSGARRQDFTYVVDVAGAVWRALSVGARGVFNIASGRAVSMLELAQSVLEAVPESRSQIVFTGDEDPQENYRAVIDVEKAKVELGWSATVPFVEGLRRTAAAMDLHAA